MVQYTTVTTHFIVTHFIVKVTTHFITSLKSQNGKETVGKNSLMQF